MISVFTDLLSQRFLQLAFAAALLAGIASGMVGTFVVTRRISYVAGAISHSVLAGLGLARYLQRVHGVEWLNPLFGALIAAIVSAFVIAVVRYRAAEREDTAISAVWAGGMALGVIFIALTPGYNADLMSYLFGNILMVSPADLIITAALVVVVGGVILLNFNKFKAVSFDEEFAALRGINVEACNLLLLCLTALTVVVLVSVVGVVMVIALLALPAAAAGRFGRTLGRIMALAVVFSFLTIVAGISLSYAPDLPAGATTIVLSVLVYFISIPLSSFLKKRKKVSLSGD